MPTKFQPTENDRAGRKRNDWRKKLTRNETWQLEHLERQIAVQVGAVAANQDNVDLLATLCLLKHRRYQLQSKAAARLKRQRQGRKSRWARTAARNTAKSAKALVENRTAPLAK
jgi:hypothetical protein